MTKLQRTLFYATGLVMATTSLLCLINGADYRATATAALCAFGITVMAYTEPASQEDSDATI